MTVDEAVRLLESNGPADGDWKSWRAAWLEAQLLLEEVSAQTLDRFAPRLRKVCVSFPNIDAQQAAAVPLVRWALERGELDGLVALAGELTYSRSLFDAIGRVAELGVEVWPLAMALIPAHEPHLLLAKLLHPDRPHAAERLAQLSPAIAMKVASELGLWTRARLTPFADTIVGTYLRETGELKKAAGRALSLLAAQPAPFALGRLEERLVEARDEEAELLSWVLAVQRLQSGGDVEELLRDERPHVRRGAIDALSRGVNEHPARWQRLLRAAVDAEVLVRTRVLVLAREGIEAGLPFDAALGREFLAHPELEEFLSFVVTKHPELGEALREGASARLLQTLGAPSRACALCRAIPRELSWGPASVPPKLAVLEWVAMLDETIETRTMLRRCTGCWAHFVHFSEQRVDVNSMYEHDSLRRLKLRELQERYPQHFDASHPRVASWRAALEADLDHVDPAVCAEAAWELAP